MGMVWDMEIEPATKLVLLALADHAEHDGRNARPGVRLLASKTGFSERQVQRILADLRDRGIIEAESNTGGRGHRPNYRIVIQKGDKMSPFPIDKGRQDVTLSNDLKGDDMSPIDEPKGDILSPFPETKGDICGGQRVTSGTRKGDICDTTLKGVNRPVNRPIEPSSVNSPLPPTKPEVAALPSWSGIPDVPTIPEEEAIRAKRHEVFAAYARGVGIKPETAEWLKRWNLSWGELSPAVLAVMTPARMLDLASFVSRRRKADGIRHVPSIELVIMAESEFDAWDESGRPDSYVPQARPTSYRPSAPSKSGDALDFFKRVAQGEQP